MDIVKEGAAETVAVLEEYNKINDMFGLEDSPILTRTKWKS